jgi:hypothetical protein
VLRGPVRLTAGLVTRLRRQDARDLAGADRPRWREVRASLERRRHTRVLRAQFRRDPAAYLTRLEQLLRQPAVLPDFFWLLSGFGVVRPRVPRGAWSG